MSAQEKAAQAALIEEARPIHRFLLRTRALQIAVLLTAYACSERDAPLPETVYSAAALLDSKSALADDLEDLMITGQYLLREFGPMPRKEPVSKEPTTTTSGVVCNAVLRAFTREEEKVLLKSLPKEVSERCLSLHTTSMLLSMPFSR
jgi:hypothetical protein